MARSRRNNGNQRGVSEVQGPNSALTSFLREQGITTEALARRNREAEENAQQARVATRRQRQDDDEPIAVLSDDSEVEQAELVRTQREKRRRAGFSDDEDEEEFDDDMGSSRFTGKRDTCNKCGTGFIISVYTIQDDMGGNLCKGCSDSVLDERRRKQKKMEATAKRQRKKLAQALLDNKVLGVPSLQEITMNVISRYIEDVEAFGEIGYANLTKLSRILSRRRKLNNQTMKLFLSPGARELEYWDCSNITADAYNMIPAVCPTIERLVLGMCGQLTGENLVYFAEKLPNLTSIYLDGPFLISKDVWTIFFETVGSKLKELTIKNTHRVDEETIAFILENCPNLTHLGLSRLNALTDASPIYLLAELKHLESLELSDNGDEKHSDDVVTDDAMASILQSVGHRLISLNLDGCTSLTDNTLAEIRRTCPKLENLSLRSVEDITNQGVYDLFHNWTANSGLLSLSLQRCINVEDTALNAVINHSKHSLVELDLNSVGLLTKSSLRKLIDIHNLTTLNVGFVRKVDDTLLNQLCHNCKHLSLIQSWGNPNITLTFVNGVKIVGASL